MNRFNFLIIGGAIAGFLVLFILPTLIYIFIAQPFKISGTSMYPILKPGEYFLVNKLEKNFKKGEIIVFQNSQNSNQDIITRISAVPDEVIESNGQLIRLEQDEYYVLGDNKDNSTDSRRLGPIKKDSIIGKYWFSYFKP